ncbi:MAG: extracellular solute-binding protein [Actinomycetota bacterium]|nr:extracellular solute-binding protein [Actinomycetota bacterium]
MAIKKLCGIAAGLIVASLAGACSGSTAAAETSSLTLYTCASENVEQAVVTAFQAAHHGITVNVFRAPTGKLNAKVAADQRSGGIKADVIWACDPLTMHGYDAQHLLGSWSPPNAADFPAAYRTAHFTAVDLLYMVLAVHKGAPKPSTWSELTGPAWKDAVALPSPSFAASAFGMLGYFASAKDYGLDYYRHLKANGAKQLDSPADVLTGVEQGTYQAGFTLANGAYHDQAKGSPIEVVWPMPGAVAIYAPIGITSKPNLSSAASSFADYTASVEGQKLMAKQGTYVVLPGMGGPPLPAGSPVASPDWTIVFGSSKTLLADYARVFGG